MVYINVLHTTCVPANSISSKTYRYYLNSTNHYKSFYPQIAIIRQLNLKMNEILYKTYTAKINDLVSETMQVIIKRKNNDKRLTANFNNRSVASVTSILLNGINEFLIEGIIYCCMTTSIICVPKATSKIRFIKNRLRILEVLGKFNS